MKFKIVRIQKGLTQKQLRELAGVGANTIVAIEKGDIEGISVRTLRKLAAALDTTVVDLFFADKN